MRVLLHLLLGSALATGTFQPARADDLALPLPGAAAQRPAPRDGSARSNKRSRKASGAAQSQVAPALPLPAASQVAPSLPLPAAQPASATRAPSANVRAITAQPAASSRAGAAQPAANVRPAAAAPAAAVLEPAEAPANRDGHGVFIGLRLGLLVPNGRSGDGSSGPDTGTWAKRAATLPVSLQLGWRLPFLERALALVAEAGYYPLSARGVRALPQDPDFGSLAYSWKATQVPLFAGLDYRLPLDLQRLSFSASASFAAVWSRYTTTYLAEGVANSPQTAWALGFGLGAGAQLHLGPGAITADLRYVNARTDLGFRSRYPAQPYNALKGDVQGMNYLLGYRFSL